MATVRQLDFSRKQQIVNRRGHKQPEKKRIARQLFSDQEDENSVVQKLFPDQEDEEDEDDDAITIVKPVITRRKKRRTTDKKKLEKILEEKQIQDQKKKRREKHRKKRQWTQTRQEEREMKKEVRKAPHEERIVDNVAVDYRAEQWYNELYKFATKNFTCRQGELDDDAVKLFLKQKHPRNDGLLIVQSLLHMSEKQNERLEQIKSKDYAVEWAKANHLQLMILLQQEYADREEKIATRSPKLLNIWDNHCDEFLDEYDYDYYYDYDFNGDNCGDDSDDDLNTTHYRIDDFVRSYNCLIDRIFKFYNKGDRFRKHPHLWDTLVDHENPIEKSLKRKLREHEQLHGTLSDSDVTVEATKIIDAECKMIVKNLREQISLLSAKGS